jgi:transposase-like protein
MREYKRLSEGEVERLILLYIGGSSMRRVGRELGVSQATVTWHLKESGHTHSLASSRTLSQSH